jgi:hypothetical protein
MTTVLLSMAWVALVMVVYVFVIRDK